MSWSSSASTSQQQNQDCDSVVDTGPIVALSTMISSMHGAKRNSRVFGPSVLTCSAVLTESSFLIADMISLLQHTGLLSLTASFLCNKRRLKDYCALGIVGL
jgi:hypothetical protein